MRNLLSLLIIISAFSACAPEPEPGRLYDELVVTTSRDPEADFTSYMTYAIPEDTIGLMSNTIEDTIIVDTELSRTVLQELNNNIQARGYTRINRNENPDIGVNVTLLHGYNVIQQLVYPDPFFYGGGFYGGYYGYNSWYYYPFVNTYAYNNGVLVVEFVDLRNKTVDNRVKVIWDAYLGDVTVSNNVVNQLRDGINEAFEQSPFIQR